MLKSIVVLKDKQQKEIEIMKLNNLKAINYLFKVFDQCIIIEIILKRNTWRYYKPV